MRVCVSVCRSNLQVFHSTAEYVSKACQVSTLMINACMQALRLQMLWAKQQDSDFETNARLFLFLYLSVTCLVCCANVVTRHVFSEMQDFALAFIGGFSERNATSALLSEVSQLRRAHADIIDPDAPTAAVMDTFSASRFLFVAFSFSFPLLIHILLCSVLD